MLHSFIANRRFKDPVEKEKSSEGKENEEHIRKTYLTAFPVVYKNS